MHPCYASLPAHALLVKHLLWRTEMGLLKFKYMKKEERRLMIVLPSGKLFELHYFSSCNYPNRIFMLHWKIPQQRLTVYFICNSFPPLFYAWSFLVYKHDTQFTRTFGDCLRESNSCKTCIITKLKAILNFALLMIIFIAACICVSHRQPRGCTRQM